MRHYPTLFLSLSLLLLLASCDSFTFKEPQPQDQKELYRFPKKLRGSYISQDDQSLLTIDEKMLVRTRDFQYIVSPAELDSGAVFINDSILQFSTGERFPFVKKDDSLNIHCHFTDTLFCIKGRDHIRKFKGYYFLNSEEKYYGTWSVMKTFFKKGVFYVHYISDLREIQLLEGITETPLDSNGTVVSINRRQFRKFVRDSRFLNGEAFIRVKKAVASERK